ncbi:DUF4278 domain-containing protein [Egbenema bharatensis]|uniref:DUF4278 domain-containing protein n=1 Tax=Egbenema bharatensis TaxID=3463334 RepID=UPI003A84DFA3
MKLSYRGTSYSYQPTPVDMVDSGIPVKFRGQQYHLSYLRHIPVPQAVSTLKYRGVSYQTTETGEIQPIAPGTRRVTALAGKAVPLPLATQVRRRLLPEDAQRVHQETIRQRLQHRIDVAKARGDEQLLHQLEDELHRFA